MGSYKFVNPKEMPRLRGQLKDLLEVEEGLTDTGVEFLENINKWDGEFTVGQADWLDKVYERVC